MYLSRRELLKLGVGSGVALAVGCARGRSSEDLGVEAATAPGSASAGAQSLVTKEIPSSGVRIPVVGVGMRDYRVDLEAGEDLTPFRESLRTFIEGGGSLLDTSPNYGNSETVCGLLLEELGMQDRVFLATKVDRQTRAEGVQRMNESLVRLRTDHVELMQVHNLRGWEEVLPALRERKEAQEFGHIGITTSSARQYARMEGIMSQEALDFIQIDYSLGNRGAAERMLPLAQDRGMAVLVNLPFGRESLFRAVGDRALPEWAPEIECESWAQVFLKYVVSHPAVTAAIPGTTKPHHAADNLGGARGTMPDRLLRAEMETFFDAL